MSKITTAIITRSWVRILVAAAILVAGIAPISTLTLSDDTVQQAIKATLWPSVAPLPLPEEFEAGANGRVLGSADEGKTWRAVGRIPEEIAQLAKSPADDNVLYARGASGVWRSADAGRSWAMAGRLPSRATALAIGSRSPGLVYAGTESLGLYRSLDGGQTWQAAGDVLADAPATVSITAVAVHPSDERIVYVAVGAWLGTTQARLTPQAIVMSPDGGRQWFAVRRVGPGEASAERLVADVERPLAITEIGADGEKVSALSLTSELVVGLQSEDAARRAAVARLLGLSGDVAYAPALLGRLGDPDPAAGQVIAEALARLQSPTTALPLLAALHDGDAVTQGRAAYVLGKMQIEAAVPDLTRLLNSDASPARQTAAAALAAIGTPAALSALMAPLAEPDLTPARHAAMRGLELAGQPATIALAEALNDANPIVRRNAAEMLGWIPQGQSTPALARSLQDSDPTVRAQAAWALGEIATPQAQRALRKAARGEAEPLPLQAIETALARAARAGVTTPAVAASPWAVLGARLAQAPADRWLLLALAIVLAVALLWIMPRLMPPTDAHRGRRAHAAR